MDATGIVIMLAIGAGSRLACWSYHEGQRLWSFD